MKAYYTGLREIYSSKPRGLNQLYNSGGSKVLKKKDKILEMLSEHFNQLLNVPGDPDKATKDRIKQRPVISLLDNPPDINSCQLFAQ